jgi:Metal binding domain of Ada
MHLLLYVKQLRFLSVPWRARIVAPLVHLPLSKAQFLVKSLGSPTAGGVGNYAFGSPMKREILRREGVDVDALEKLAKGGIRYVGSRTTKIVCFPTCRDAKRIREENRVPFRAAGQAREKGFRPCLHCQPFAA